MKKLEIEIPNDKEIDWEASAKQKKIVFKKKQLTYEEVSNALFEKTDNYFITSFGQILPNIDCAKKDFPNIATSKHQLQCILAKNKLANVARYLNGDWKHSSSDKGWVIGYNPALDYHIIVKIEHYTDLSNVVFKTRELAEEAIQIIGEETVKLALTPLY